MSKTMEKIGEIGLQIHQLAPLAVAGVTGAIQQITHLIDALKGEDLTTPRHEAQAVGQAEVSKLEARAAEAQAFLDAQKTG